MGGGGKPRGIFDDVPTIGSGQEPGSGDGSSSTTAAGVFDDVPTIKPEEEEAQPFAPPEQPTALRDRLTDVLDRPSVPPPSISAEAPPYIPPPAPVAPPVTAATPYTPPDYRARVHPEITTVATPDQPTARFLEGLVAGTAKGAVQFPVDLARETIGPLLHPEIHEGPNGAEVRPPAETRDPLQRIGDLAHLGKELVTFPIEGAKEMVNNPDPFKKGEGAAGVLGGLFLLHGGIHAAREGQARAFDRIAEEYPANDMTLPGKPAEPPPPPSEPPTGAERPPEPESTVIPPPPPRSEPPKAEPAGLFDDVPVVPPKPTQESAEGPPSPEPGTAVVPAGKPPERVKAAAVEIDGHRFEGPDHFAAIQRAMEAGFDPDEVRPGARVHPESYGTGEGERIRSGYVTDQGRFVDDKEGLELARTAGQFKPGPTGTPKDAGGSEYLDSADLKLEGSEAPERRPIEPPSTKPGTESGNEDLARGGAIMIVDRHLEGVRLEQEIAGEKDPARRKKLNTRLTRLTNELKRIQEKYIEDFGQDEARRYVGEELNRRPSRPIESEPELPAVKGMTKEQLEAESEQLYGDKDWRQKHRQRLAEIGDELDRRQEEEGPQPTGGAEEKDAGDEIRQESIDGLTAQAEAALRQIQTITDKWTKGHNGKRKLTDDERQSLLHTRGAYQDVYRRALEQIKRIDPAKHEAFLRKHEPQRFEQAPAAEPHVETKQEANDRWATQIERESSTRQGDRPVRETLGILRQLAERVEASHDRAELEQLYKDLADLYDGAGAGEIRSQIGGVRAEITRRLKKLPKEGAIPPREYVTRAEVNGNFTPEQEQVRRITRGLKEGDVSAVELAADEMAKRVPRGASIVPIPGSGVGHAPNLALAKAIADRVGGKVFDSLERVEPIESSRLNRRRGKPGPSLMKHRESLRRRPGAIPVGKPVVLIDNLEVTGTTGKAAREVLGRKDAELVTYAKAKDPRTIKTEPGPEPAPRKPPPAKWSADPRVPVDQRAQAETAAVAWWNGMSGAERWEVIRKYHGEGAAPFARHAADRDVGVWGSIGPAAREMAFDSWIREERPEWNPKPVMPTNPDFVKTRIRLRTFLSATRQIEKSFAREGNARRQEKLQRDMSSNLGEIEKMSDRIAAKYGKDVRDAMMAELEEEVKQLHGGELGDMSAHEKIEREDEERLGKSRRQQRNEKIESGRIAKYEKMGTTELLEEHHRLLTRLQKSEGGHGWTRYDDDVGEMRSGGRTDSRAVDDNKMLDLIQAELGRRGMSDDDLMVSYYEYVDRTGERGGIQDEENGRGMPPDASDFHPDALENPAEPPEPWDPKKQPFRVVRTMSSGRYGQYGWRDRVKTFATFEEAQTELERAENGTISVRIDKINGNKWEKLAERKGGTAKPKPKPPKPDTLENPADLFGDVPLEGEAEEQGSMFGEKEGTAASRSTPQHLRALAAERDKLAQLLKGKLKDSPSANRRLAELDRILNADRKISADELGTRARGEEHLDPIDPRGAGQDERGQGDLLSPGPERIRAAAVRDPDTGKVYEGRTHADAIEVGADAGASWSKLSTEWDEGTDNVGFVTDAGRFVTREEAAQIAKSAKQLKYPKEFEGDDPNIDLVHWDLDLDYPAAARGRPYTLEDLDTASDRQLDRYLRYEERIAQDELLDEDRGGNPGAPAGQPSKTIADLEVLENELRAAEKKLSEVTTTRLKQILEAQVHNRTRQQEAYVREWVDAGRADELPPLVRDRFKDMKPGGTKPPPGGTNGRSSSRDDWERRMRQEAERRQREREQRQRERQQQGGTDRDRERQERERERQERERERGSRRRAEPPPPPRPPPPPKPPPPGSMNANPHVPPPKNAGGKVRSLFRIGRMFADAMKATVYQGRGRPRFPNQALGFFKLASEAIRVQRADWLDVIAHEVGHHISKLYLKHPSNRGAFARGAIPLTPEMMRELRVMGKNLYGTRKAALGYAEEGIAEWAKFYVVDPARAAREAPKFNDFMEQTVFKDPSRSGPMLEKAFTAAREHYARYEHATPLERILAQIDTDPPRIRLPGIRDLVTHWLDDLEEFRRFDIAAKVGNARESVYQLARLARGAPARAYSWLKDGMVDIRDGRRIGRSVVDALTAVGEKNFPEFRAYLVAKSALERWENGINPGIRLQDARDVVNDLEAKYKPQAEVIWDHYRMLLEAKVHAGQLTPEAYRLILAKNKTHVGFYRVFEDFERPATGTRGGARGIRSGPGVPRQKGSAREIIDPLESIMQDTYRTAASISRAQALGTLVKLAHREGMGHYIDEVPAPMVQDRIYAPKVLEQLQALGLVKMDPATGQISPLAREDLLGQVLTAFSEADRPGQAELKDLVIPHTENGVTRWYQIRDRKMYDAIEGLDPVELAGFLRWYSAPVRGFRAGVTLTAQFIVKNLFRDAGTAFVRTRSTRPVLPWEHFVTGAFHWLKSPELVARWRESGGDNATQLGLDRPTTSHNMKRLVRQNGHGGSQLYDIVRHPIDAIRVLSSVGENVTRLGEYAIVERQGLKKGLGPREAQTRAGFASRDVTQDFWMAGKSGRAVNQIIAFFNAQLNSVANLGRDLRHRPEVVLPRLIAGITLPSLALYLAQRKDPEYQRIPRWQKDLGWIYLQRGHDQSAGWDRYGSGKVEHRWFIPKPFELGVLFGSTFERIAEWAITEKPEAWDQFSKSVYQALAPSLVPHVLEVAHELKANHDEFRDRPIVPRGLEGVEPRYQSRSTTGEMARALGDAAPGRGISPAKIEHAVGGLAGGVGLSALGAADAGVRAFRQAVGLPPLRDRSTVFRPDPDEDPLTQVPGLAGLVRRDPKEQSEDIERTYRLFEQAEQSRKTWQYLLKEGRRKEADKYLRDHRDEIRSVATAEETGSAPGGLRARYEAITKLQGVSRERPERRDENVNRMHRLTERR